MERILSIGEIAAACGGELEFCDANTFVSDIITDSRNIIAECAFIALRGEKFDGHSFFGDAVNAGATVCIADKNYSNSNGYPLVVVEDTYKALRDIATLYRSKFSIPSLAITGSVGKTSTKDMVASVLGNKYNVLKTEGNFNNEIGLPLTAFRIEKGTDVAVFEMGMSAFGEISRLTRIAVPETAIITNIGMSHIEHLGSRENILKAKLEILEGMSEDEGTVIINGDDDMLKNVVGTLPFETLTYGIDNLKCDLVASDIRKMTDGTIFNVRIEGTVHTVRVNVPGIHHVYNALAGILVGIKYNMSVEKIIEGVAKFQPQGMRQNTVRLKNYVVIKDCYNASPTSMKSGLDVLSVTQPLFEGLSCRRIAVLGEMLELGDFAASAHYDVGALVAESEADILLAVGPHSSEMAKGAVDNGFNSEAVFEFKDKTSAKELLAKMLKQNDILMFKASRGMRLEELADFVIESDSEAH